jgi:predicted DNA-binding transcriptional regulator YafY
MNLSRIQRLLKLISLLQLGRGQNVRSLATDCGVSRRTIFRDLDVLRAAGVPLEFNDEVQSYRIPHTYLLPPTNFSAEEALAVLVLCDELGGNRRLPFYAPARSAALKLHAALPTRLRNYLQDVAGAIRIRLGPRAAIDEKQPVYDRLIDALARRLCVRITYDSLYERDVIKTRLSPYRLMFSRRSWYVIGRSSVHRQIRTFHVGRILKLEPTNDSYRIQRGFSLEHHLRNAWHIIPGAGPDWDVHIRFHKLVARNVAEVRWHETQQTQWRDDGSLDFHVTVSGLEEISWWILGYGDQAEVVAPAKLRELIAQRVHHMAEIYNGKP